MPLRSLPHCYDAWMAPKTTMRRTLLTGLGILVFICGAALASPSRITLHIPARTGGTEAPAPDRIERIRRDIEHLSVTIGERNHRTPAALAAAEAWATGELESAGLAVSVQDIDGVGHNLIAERAPAGERDIVVVGAHLDTAVGTPGADDNASGVAALLELARNPALGSRQAIRYVVYGNEEPPYFQTEQMGSRIHARSVQAGGDRVVGAWILESIGYYSDAPHSQSWPLMFGLLMPTTANFVLLVGNPASADLVQDGIRKFRERSTLPSVGASVPGSIQGVDWSDHAEYWRVGLPAVMVTDMPPLRNPHYHEATDLPGVIEPARVAAVVDGMESVLR
ncbi:MAG: M28 family peptidase [Myxococcales bacterium]|nr:M28 family peptidase [Myxococcales bacterium]